MVQSSRISKDKDGTKRIKIGFMSRSRNFRLLSRLMGALKKGPVAVPLNNNRTLFYSFAGAENRFFAERSHSRR